MDRLPAPLASFAARVALPEPFLRYVAPLSLFVVGFDAERFSDGQFSTAALDCPESIARSVRRRRAEFYHGRLCARFALRDMGVAAAQVGIGASREPRWPLRVVGSITHSDTMAAAAVVSEQSCAGLGIDLAACIGAAAIEDMVGIVVSPREYAYLRSLSAIEEIEVCVTLVFSAKESFFKAVFNHVQQYFNFDAIDVVAVDFAASIVLFDIKRTLCDGIVAGQQCRIPFALLGEHVLTVFRFPS